MTGLLIVSATGRQFFLFEAVNIEVLQSLGVHVEGAANLKDEDHERLSSVPITLHDVGIERSPFSPRNVVAFIKLVRLLRSGRYDAVHCHSPMGGVVGRLAALVAGVPKILYTAHGFHFFRGAPLVNWLLYFPVEWLLASVTDVLITMNEEDFGRALRMPARSVSKVPGVGVHIERFTRAPLSRDAVRARLGIRDDQQVFLCVGELIPRKNHAMVIRAMSAIPDALLLICGRGEERDELERLVKDLNLEGRVHFLGYQRDMVSVYASADVFVTASLQEGLPVSVIEAMSAGLPVVCSGVRGHLDLVEDGKNGTIFPLSDVDELVDALAAMSEDSIARRNMGEVSLERAVGFSSSSVSERVRTIYGDALREFEVVGEA